MKKYNLQINKNKLFLMSIITLVGFFILALMARPRLVLDSNPVSIILFLLISLVFALLIGLNVFKIFKKQKKFKTLADIIIPLVIIIPLYVVILGFNSLFDVLYKEYPLIAILLLIFTILATVINLFYLVHNFLTFDKEEEKREELVLEVINSINKNESPLWKYIIYLTVLGVAFFAYALFNNDFTIPFGGDYTQQQIPFYTNGYDDYWHFFKTGQFPLWDSNTFLGVNNIGSNAFYYSINPFFLPILLFPRDLIPQGIAVLMIIKFVLAGLSMRLFLKHFGLKETTVRLFALIYAFAGWNVYYLWFNHMMEVAVIFPLVFLGIEKVFKEKKPYVLIVGLGLMGLANYFYLVSISFMGVMYALVRYIQLFKTFKKPSDHFKILGIGVLGFAIGIAAGGAALLPGINESLNSDRVSDASYLDNIKKAIELKNYSLAWDYVTMWTTTAKNYYHKQFYPLITYFFPVLSNRSVSLLNTSSYDNTISSLFVYSPTIMLLIPSLMLSMKKKRFDHLLIFAAFLFMIFTPFFYNAFHVFTVEYGRWQIFAVIILVLYIAVMFEKREQFKRYYFDISFVIVVLLMAFTHLFAYNYQGKNNFGKLEERELVVFYQYVVVSVSYIILRQGFTSPSVSKPLFSLVSFEAVVMGVITIIGHGVISYQRDVNGGLKNVNDDQVVIRKIKALDDTYYRIINSGAARGHENVPMREGYNGLSAFHSLYNYELKDFLSWSKVSYNRNGWSMSVNEKRAPLANFLGVKYYVVKDTDLKIPFTDGTSVNARYANVPTTHTYNQDLSSPNRYVYEDSDIFNFGYGVRNVITNQIMTTSETSGEEEAIDTFYISGMNGTLRQEEMYQQSGILSSADLKEVLNNYPSLKTFNPSTYQPVARTLATNATYSNRISKTYYQCDQFYPYQNPSDANLSNACNIVASMTTMGYRDAIEYKKTDGTNLLDDGGHIILQWPLSSRVRIFLYDVNDELITFDHHTYGGSYSGWKVLRGISSPETVKKLVVASMGENKTESSYTIFTYTKDQIQSLIDETTKYPLLNVKVKTNEFNFETNYEEDTFVVTTIPYDDGWKVRTLTSDLKGGPLKVYKTHGGFVGFVAPAGTRGYSMSFNPKYFTVGTIATVGGFYIGIFGLVTTYFYNKKKSKLAKAVN